MKLQLNPFYGLYERDGHAFCDSLQVAETFKKEHKSVLQAIEGETRKGKHVNGLIDNLRSLAVNPADYFVKSTYKDTQNKTQPRYLLSSNGFNLVAMGFTGKEALMYKLEYITRFNSMKSFIQSLFTARLEYPAFAEAVYLAHTDPQRYHFANELNMIYRIVLGMDARQYREQHSIDAGSGIRPCLTLPQIQAIETLQRVDIGLLEAGLDYSRRKSILQSKHRRMTARLTA